MMAGRILAYGLLCLGAAGTLRADEAVDFNRDIRPILSKRCFQCHGPDGQKRKANLRLDHRESAVQTGGSNEKGVIVPGHPEQSELYRRITAEDASRRMPAEGKPLDDEQIELIRKWIEQGAPYDQHWAFQKPQHWPLPEVKDDSWPKNGIDNFVLRRLQENGLKPSPPADKFTLIRRLSFDLRGLPPTPEEVKRFLKDDSPHAYEKLVDRFLADPAYGERWAAMWLDLARYADSAGYGSDPLREIWRYRDWVIDAFNRNLPYDRFTIEQLAGDLLNDPTRRQKIATAFHRNTMTNTEGGTDDEEFRVAAVKDRVDTTMLVWMGLTMSCAKCHDHKFDPIKQSEYYRFYEFFNQTADRDRRDEAPTIKAPTDSIERELKQIEARIADLKEKLATPTPELAKAQRQWETRLRQADKKPVRGRYVRIELPGKNRILSLAEVQVFSGGKNVAPQGHAEQSSTDFGGKAGRAIDGNTDGHYHKAESTTHTKRSADPWWQLDLQAEKPIEKIVVWNRTDGPLESRLKDFRLRVLDESEKPVAEKTLAKPPRPKTEIALNGPRSAVPEEILTIIDMPREQRSQKEKKKLAAYYRSQSPLLDPVRKKIDELKKSKPEIPTVPVMQQLPPEKQRETHILKKGNFLEKGEKVTAGVPQAFHDWEADFPKNRLGVAQWLMDDDNPLTARVAVNRFWGRLFGRGLVPTPADFGTQGEPPSHPKLLDWLAVEFRQQDWDMKRLLRLMVTSATYRQTSQVRPELLKEDPNNVLLSRGPRFRLPAEMIRDQALALSGLLQRKMGGPSVYPPQPDGLWRAAFNGRARKWPTDQGIDRYRRSLYTFWRRTIPYPSMDAFDAPSREVCEVRRVRTNTPLQAFVTMNDPVYVEAAQALARRIIRQGGSSIGEKVRFGLRLCLVRPPQERQVQELLDLYRDTLDKCKNKVQAARQLATEPLGPLPKDIEPQEAAAWTVVAGVLLNLDAVLVKN